MQLLSWQGGGARTPQHQCLDEIFFLIYKQGPKPHILISALIGHWEMPAGHSQQIYIQMIFDTVWEQNCAKRLQVQIGQTGCHFRKQWKSTEQEWQLRRFQFRVVLMPRNLQLTDHPGAGLFPLSHGPALLELQMWVRSQPETLLLWTTLGVLGYIGYPSALWVLWVLG